MRLNAQNELDAIAVPKHHNRRVQISIGPWRFSATAAEALALANALTDAAEAIGEDQPAARPDPSLGHRVFDWPDMPSEDHT